MNSAFILIGLTLMFTMFYKFRYFIVKHNVAIYLFTLITAFGVIIVGLINGGNPLTSGYHTLGAVMAILGGNTLLILISRSMAEFGNFQKITLVLGVFGMIGFWIMFFDLNNIYMPVFERLSVYTLVLWNFLAGVYILKN